MARSTHLVRCFSDTLAAKLLSTPQNENEMRRRRYVHAESPFITRYTAHRNLAGSSINRALSFPPRPLPRYDLMASNRCTLRRTKSASISGIKCDLDRSESTTTLRATVWTPNTDDHSGSSRPPRFKTLPKVQAFSVSAPIARIDDGPIVPCFPRLGAATPASGQYDSPLDLLRESCRGADVESATTPDLPPILGACWYAMHLLEGLPNRHSTDLPGDHDLDSLMLELFHAQSGALSEVVDLVHFTGVCQALFGQALNQEEAVEADASVEARVIDVVSDRSLDRSVAKLVSWYESLSGGLGNAE
jgi:hypothetical protein